MREKRKTNLFIVGAAKCGTTSLFRYLEQLPEIFTTEPKEPRFFATDIPDRHRLIKYLENYENLYRTASANAAYLVDASPAYMYSRNAAKEIHSYNPEAKIIVMLRPPVEAVHSVHAQYLWQCDEDIADFSKAWALSDARSNGKNLPKNCSNPLVVCYKVFALFSEQLERYYRFFKPEQIHVILLEDMQRDVENEFVKVLNFLGLKYNAGSVDFTARNPNTYHRSRWLMRVVRGKFAGYSLIRDIAKALGLKSLKTIRSFVTRANTKVEKRRCLDKELHQEIVGHYAADVSRLERLISRDLKHWRSLEGKAEVTVQG